MENELKVTSVADILLPQVPVTLSMLKTRDGQPVVVLCESRDELTIADVTGGLSGFHAPSSVTAEEALGGTDALNRMLDQKAQALIEIATSLVTAEGEEVRPAFWFNETTPRHPRSLPGRLLRFEDRLLLLNGILRAGNYTRGDGSALPDTTFPVHGAGSEGRVGAGAAGEPDAQTSVSLAGVPDGSVGDEGRTREAGASDAQGSD